MPRYMLINQYDCETQIVAFLNDTTVDAVREALIPVGLTPEQLAEAKMDSFYQECAEACIENGITELGGRIDANLDDTFYDLHLIKLGD